MNDEHTNSKVAEDNPARRVWSDPVILGGSLLTAFGLIGIADTVITWRDFFQNFYDYWIRLRDSIFSVIPFELTGELKSIIIINVAAASILLRAAYLLRSRAPGQTEKMRLTVLITACLSALYALLFFPFIVHLREALHRLSISILGDQSSFIGGVALVANDLLFAAPFFALVIYIAGIFMIGFRAAPRGSEERTVAVTTLATTIVVFGFLAAIIILCIRW